MDEDEIHYNTYMSNATTQHVIMMGVSGCGKTEIGSLLAEKLSWTFFDADDFLSNENITKMSKLNHLEDIDSDSWFNDLQSHLIKLHERYVSSVLACSCVKEDHRKIFSQLAETYEGIKISFVYLDTPYKIAHKRLKKRKFQFMPLKLLQSQFDTLEEPRAEREHINLYKIDNSSQSISDVLTLCIEALSR